MNADELAAAAAAQAQEDLAAAAVAQAQVDLAAAQAAAAVQVQADLDAAAQAAAAAQANAAMANAVPPQYAFVLDPSDPADTFVDLNSAEGRKIYAKAIAPLPTKYDGTQGGLSMFIHDVHHKVMTTGWSATLYNIPYGPAPPQGGAARPMHSLFREYGLISIDDMRAHATTYIGQQTKTYQDANLFKWFLNSSLDKDLMMAVMAQSDQYTINGFEDGPTMFRVIMSIVGIESTATIANINESLRELPAKMAELNGDILKFNEFVTSQVKELTARGTEPHDLLFILFKAYLTVKDVDFVEYIRAKKNAVFDNSVAMTYRQLLNTAAEKYKLLVTTGEWQGGSTKAGSKHDDHIIALTAAIEKVLGAKKKPGKGANNPKDNKSAGAGKWKWKEEAPKPGESHHKTIGGKDYVHCPHHKATQWVLASNHKDGCSIDAKWCYPAKGDAPHAMIAAQGKQGETNEDETQKAFQALMSVLSEERLAELMGMQDDI